MDAIDLTDLDKADVLAALYNASRPLGMGFLNYDPAPMGKQEAAALLEQSTYFDYLKGRVMKVDLSGETLDPSLYDRDNHPGAAAKVIAALRAGDTATAGVMHKQGVQESAALANNRIHQETRTETSDGTTVMHLGLADVQEELVDAIAHVKKANSPD